MLADGADVSIAGTTYMLATEADNHYVHTFQPVVPDSSVISGVAGIQSFRLGAENIRPGRLLWEITDWSGGEGNRIFYTDDQTRYDRSTAGANPRIPGMLFGPPTQTTQTISSSGGTSVLMGVGAGAVWVCSKNLTFYSTDGVTFSAGPTLSAGHVISAVVGTEDYLYVSSLTGTTRYIYRCTTSTATEVTNQTNSIRFAGMAIYQGWLYGWTGRKLWGFDLSQTLPLSTSGGDPYRVKVYDTGIDSGGAWGTYSAGLVNGENSLFMLLTHQGSSVIYEYRLAKLSGSQPLTGTTVGAGRPAWRPGGIGFTAQSITCCNGILYAAGHWGTAANGTGKAELFGMDLATRQIDSLAKIRQRDSNLTLGVSAPSYGNQVIIADQQTPAIFIYDAEYDSLSELDAVAESPTSLLTWGPYRYAAGLSGANVKLHTWVNDEPSNRAVNSGTTVDVGDHDFRFPFEVKVLKGFHVGFQTMVANQSITIGYQLDDSGSFTNLTPITSATTGASTGRAFVSTTGSTLTFHDLRFRIITAGTSGAQDPIVLSVTAEAEVQKKDHYIDLAIRTKDETPGTRRAGHQDNARTIRQNLYALAQAGTFTTFLDGAVSPMDGIYDTYTVSVQDVQDIVLRRGEGGYCRVRLLVVPT